MADTDNNLVSLLKVLVAPIQEIEDTLRAMLAQRAVDNAVGAQLDIIGALVGQPRDGLVDADYRRYIRGRISANRSNGTIEDLLKVAYLIVYDSTAYYQIDNQGNACVVMRILNISLSWSLSDILIGFLKDTAAAGVRVILEYTSATPGTTFKWDTAGRGWDSSSPFVDAKD